MLRVRGDMETPGRIAATPEALDFTVENVEKALHQLYYDPNIENKNLAQKWLMQAQVSPQAWQFCWALLSPDKVPEIQYFGASALHTKISRYWSDIPTDQYESLKTQLFSQIACFSSGSKMVLTRLCVALASLALNTMPEAWPGAVAEMVRVFQEEGGGVDGRARCLALLELLTVLPEEFQTSRLPQYRKGQVRGALGREWGSVCPLLQQLLRRTDSPGAVKARVLRCLSSWVLLDVPLSESEGLVHDCFSALPDPELFDTAVEAIVNAISQPDSQRYVNTLLKLVPQVLALQEQLREAVQNGDMETCHGICRIAVTLGENHSRTLLEQVDHWQSFLALVNMIMFCTGIPGHYPVNETTSSLTLTFWYTLQDEIMSFESDKQVVYLQVYRPVYFQLVDVLLHKAQFPSDQEYESWSSDEKEQFRIYRVDISDTLMYVYEMLGAELLSNLYDKLGRLLTNAEQPTSWQHTEALLYGFQSIAETIDVNYSDVIPGLIGLIPRININNVQLADTVMFTIGALAEWLADHPVMLSSVLPLVLQALGNPDLSVSSVSTLKKICRECKYDLPPYATNIVAVSQEVLIKQIHKTSQCMWLMQALGFLLSALPVEDILRNLHSLITPYIQQLEKLADETPNPSNKLAIIHILGLLSNLFTTLDISKQDDESADGSAPPVKTAPPPPGPNPVVVVLQQVFALIQTVLSKWLNDSQVVEVSHRYVRPHEAVCAIFEKSVKTLLHDFAPMVSQLSEMLGQMYSTIPQASALDLTRQTELLPHCSDVPPLARVVQEDGKLLIQAVLEGIGGGASRSLMDQFAEVLFCLNKHCFSLLAVWLKEALQPPGFPSSRVTTEQKDNFSHQILRGPCILSCQPADLLTQQTSSSPSGTAKGAQISAEVNFSSQTSDRLNLEAAALMAVVRFYSNEAVSGRALQRAAKLYPQLSVTTELCYNVELTGCQSLGPEQKEVLLWLFRPPLQAEALSEKPNLTEGSGQRLVEIGPRLNFSTAWSTNAVSICQSAGLTNITRVELSRRFLIKPKNGESVNELNGDIEKLIGCLYDGMTECIYRHPIASFAVETEPQPVFEVDILGKGRAALEKANDELGLAFDSWDLDFYTSMFQRIKRNPTSVECFDLAQSNRWAQSSLVLPGAGRMEIDGQEQKETLFSLIMDTQRHSNQNNVIKFCDNSSGIKGMELECIYPKDPSQASSYETRHSLRHVIFTAETHNFPTGVAPFSGATTGTGGRIRDVQSAGRGGHVIAGTAGYCFGNLHIPGYALPWEFEGEGWEYPSSFAPPLQVAVEASDGASDYGNKFGEPVLSGFARSFGMRLANGERREWIKPIMFSGGLGSIEDTHIKKEEAEAGMEVVKIGGPVYRIGVGGGAASSVQVQGDNASDRDLGAVQRGDAEMEQKMNRALRACLERSSGNPICSIHDQGAGGNGNVLKELSEPTGAVIYCSRFKKGDPTLSVLELWGAEYQESNALLLRPSDRSFLERVCQREKCPVDFVGNITGDGKARYSLNQIVLVDDQGGSGDEADRGCCPVDLQLEWVLGKMPQKEFKMQRLALSHQPLALPAGLKVKDALDRVLRLPAVASKRYLTNKVDRSVTGLVAQQQCVGPLHTPLADVAVVALSPFSLEGAATAIGEQPIKGLVCPAAGARMAVGEALTNLVFARVTALKDVKCSGNWMWAAKLPGEGASLWEACKAMCDVMGQLGVAVDGGKDSLSMAARVGKETVKAPGALVISAYAVCPDITATVTPDLEDPDGKGVLLWVPLSPGRHRLGGSALAQCYSQLGDCSPDLDQPQLLTACFNTTQTLIHDRLLSAGHDISDGGLISCLLEMAFAGNRGIDVELSSQGAGVMELLFSEELGLVLEVSQLDVETVCQRYIDAGLLCHRVGRTCAFGPEAVVSVRVDGQEVLRDSLPNLRTLWEDTSFQLERLQANEICVKQEEEGLAKRTQPYFKLTFDPCEVPSISQPTAGQPRVAVVREEGSNGDREMSVSLYMAGFEVWDVTMQDLCSGSLTLESYKAVVFVGGFSYADVLGSAKGWAATVGYNPKAKAEFDRFRQRGDTLSLGVCNGCQLLALLGWVGQDEDGAETEVVLTHNKSGRFESRFVSVGIKESPSIWLKGMEGSALGVWVAHGEGLMQFRNFQAQEQIISGGLAPLRYLDDQGHPTEEYPLNPNGSPPWGIAGLCSRDGRHLAMMPHPERCTLGWQWPWAPRGFRSSLSPSPWLRMFKNAAAWCSDTKYDSRIGSESKSTVSEAI
ncbi:hypothetical protein L3Q82_008027 [Scortum barcoo]|uniref:Uncharacterized protein n=1 Tax=Scortum barcoo TaxID=214431 RepID=A0ACB8WL47_9TELE|nr:hypothetical protein L3Q82_008027 [Scortum barcoo]